MEERLAIEIAMTSVFREQMRRILPWGGEALFSDSLHSSRLSTPMAKRRCP